MLHLYQSNRLEDLAAMMARLYAVHPPHNPMAQEQIIVHSRGMRRFIQHFLARQNGIAANLKFSLPAGFSWQLIRELVGKMPETNPFDSEVMRWRLLDLFASETFRNNENFQAAYTALGSYLDNGGTAAYHLSGQIADVFDQYLVYRPDWIAAWTEGKPVPELADDADHAWQMPLWRFLDNGHYPVPHRVQLWNELIQQIQRPEAAAKLPERFCVFGIAALAPMYLNLLQQLAKHKEIHIFALNPSEKFWGDIVEPAQILRDSNEPELSRQGHPLLATLGKQGRDFFNALSEAEIHSDISAFPQEALSGSLLHTLQYHIQSQILPEDASTEWAQTHDNWLQNRVFPRFPQRQAQFQAACLKNNTPPAHTIARLNADTSMEIHSTHSPLRELQILKDRLLVMLSEHPDWQPHDIAVLTPHIEPYVPYLDTVFGGQADGRALPYSLSDIKISYRQPLLDALEQLLDILQSRFEADTLLTLLDNGCILSRFGLSESDLPLLQDTVAQLNIRWGSDNGERAQHGADNALFTWQQGLERLILGWAMPDNGQLWENTSPYPSHPDHIAAYSRFAAVIELLTRTKQHWQQPDTVSGWCGRLRSLCQSCLNAQTDSDRNALQHLEKQLATWQQQAETAEFHGVLDMHTAVEHIKTLLGSSNESAFLRGGITICNMVPMRSLPFKAVCLLGLNDGDFPRNTKAAPFDLIAKQPRAGDRSRRNDDRYLFLEAVLSARELLYLSYIGKDIRSDEERAPSALLNALLDTVAALCGLETAELNRHWVRRHPLQPFSRRYFSDSLTPGTRQDYAEALNQPVQDAAPFLNTLPEQPDTAADLPAVSQHDFFRFWRNPARYWLQHHLNWQQPYTGNSTPADEPFTAEQSRQLSDAYLNARQQHQSFDTLTAALRAQSRFPDGELGALIQNHYNIQAAAANGELLHSKALPEQSGTFAALSGSLNYRLAHNHEHGQILYAKHLLNSGNAHGKLSAADKTELLLRHLIYCAATDENFPAARNTHYLSLQCTYSLHPLTQANAQACLKEWLAAYFGGQRHPIPFLPRTTLEAACALYTKQDGNWEKDALPAAAKAYHGGYSGFAQEDYPEIRLLYGRGTEEPPYHSTAFRRLTENLFAPLSECLKTIEAVDRNTE